MEHVEILLIRHGRTRSNVERRFLGRTDTPLDEVGRAQAEGLAARLRTTRVDRVVSSPLTRAWATALPLRRPVWLVPDLREMDQGVFEGRRPEEVMEAHACFFRAWQEDPGAVVVPGGEGLAEVRARGLAALARLLEGGDPGSWVALVSHQMVLSALASAVDGAPLRRWRDYRSDHTCGWRLRWDGDRLRLVGRLTA